MSLNRKCPRCGSSKVQLSNENKKHGILWLILFGIFYFIWWIIKASFALMVLICWDWWMAIIKKHQNKGYVWVSSRMIANSSKTYYCHNCGHNFKA